MLDFLTSPLSLLHSIIVLVLVLCITFISVFIGGRSARLIQRTEVDLMGFVRSELEFIDQLVLTVEDLINAEPERSEALEVSRLNLLERRNELEKFTQGLADSNIKRAK